LAPGNLALSEAFALERGAASGTARPWKRAVRRLVQRAAQRVAGDGYREAQSRESIVDARPVESDGLARSPQARLHVCHDTPGEADATMANPGYF
jgi:hypothetical protein